MRVRRKRLVYPGGRCHSKYRLMRCFYLVLQGFAGVISLPLQCQTSLGIIAWP